MGQTVHQSETCRNFSSVWGNSLKKRNTISRSERLWVPANPWRDLEESL
jgi:hypothetical protein